MAGPMIYYARPRFYIFMLIFKPADDLQNQIDAAVRALRNGGVAAIPTDTLYALVACALDERAVQRIFSLKGRPESLALPLILADPEDISLYAANVPELAWALADRFWPGALTLVLEKAAVIPDIVTGGSGNVALRVPHHETPRSIARELDAPITGTSANRTGRPGLRTAQEVRAEFGREVNPVLDGECAPAGLASTVLDISEGRPRILRRGAVLQHELEDVCGPVIAG